MSTWLLRAGMARWQIARVGTIPICLHWSWALVPLLLAWASQGRPVAWSAAEVATTLALAAAFGAGIVAHELGHAWIGRRAGIGGWEITLTAAGGLLTSAQLWPGRLRPGQEVVLALTGPAVSLGLAGGLVALRQLAGESAVATWAETLAMANLLLAGVNLVPIFPLDGGRVLRALLARADDAGATRIACRLGIGVGVVLVAVGAVLTAPGVLAVAGVAMFGSWQELAQLGAEERAGVDP